MYLDTAERDTFAKKSHDYLIEQVQYVNADPVGSTNENTPSVIRMQYNHPVKELIWCYQTPSPASNPNSLWNFSSGVSNVNVTVDTAVLAGAGASYAPAHVGAPALYVPGLLSSPLYLSAATTTPAVTIGTTYTYQSNVASAGNIKSSSGFAVLTAA
jgi:hypothetical protein